MFMYSCTVNPKRHTLTPQASLGTSSPLYIWDNTAQVLSRHPASCTLHLAP